MEVNYKQRAKDSLSGVWGYAIVISILIGFGLEGIGQALNYGSLEGLSIIFGIAVAPIVIGQMKLKVAISNGEKDLDLGEIFYGFKDNKYLINLAALLVRSLYVFFWTLLLIIPGIVKGYAYSMTEFILQDQDFLEKDLSAITKSMDMMDGHKGDLFILDLSFLGWYILSIFTLGLLLLYVIPYHEQARVEFFNHVKELNMPRLNTESFDDEDDTEEFIYE